MQKIAIIDLGSNTTRLIVMAYERGYCFRLIDEVSEAVRLAEGVGPNRELQSKPIRRAVNALSMFDRFCKSTGIEHVVAVGTSAIREAANQDEFWTALRAETSLDLRIITTQEEAYYGFLGAANALGLRHGITFDTGGGSTQVVAVHDGRPSESFSVQAGVLRFTERYVNSDPISKRDLRELRAAAQQAFAPLAWLKADTGQRLAGMGGTVRTLARVDQKAHNYPIDRVHAYTLTREAIAAISEQLVQKQRREREQMPGLKRDRADVTLAGAVIIEALMDQGGFSELMVSGQGLREGLFYAHFLAPNDPPILEDPRSFSILNLARLSHFQEAHCRKVAELSLSLFDQLTPLHGYGAWERDLLAQAAMIHDIGVAVGYYDHHKHGEYLVHNSLLLGFSHRESVLLSALVRNHRKGFTDASPYASLLKPDDNTRIARLSALLRIAEYLERGKSQVVQAVRVELGTPIRILVQAAGDAQLEVWDAARRSNLFRKAYDHEVEILLAPEL